MIDTDASVYQLGCTLLQEHEEANDWRPVGYCSYSLSDSEGNYSATERECFAVVWAVRTLRPYVEGTQFTVQTDHNALQWLMFLTESSGRLTRWRLRLAEYDFTIQYRPGSVHQVPDALSRLVSTRVTDDPRPVVEVDDDIPTFDAGTTVHDVSNELADHVCTASCDHKAVHVFVTTRNQTGSRRRSRARTRNEPRGDDEAPALEGTTSFWEENDEFDAVDIERAEATELDAPASPVAPQQDDLPAPLTIEEIAEEQRVDDFCQTVLARQSESRDSAFFEDHHGVLRRRHPFDPDIVQVVVPRTLQARLLQLCHNPTIAGHPGQNRMYYALRREYYWPHLAADVAATVRGCWTCAMNRVKLRKHLNRLKLFPATRPLESLAIDILVPLPKTKAGKRFLLVITDRFTKLTQVVALRTVTAYTVTVAFCDAWVFKYCVPRSLLSDNGPQFNAKFLHSTCRVLGVTNLYTSAYHPQTNGQVERYNRTIASMLRNYVSEHQDDWDAYVGPPTYAYNSHVHRTKRTTPFELVLSRPPPEFSLRRTDGDAPSSDRGNARAEF